MNDPLLEQLLDRAGAKDLAVDLVLCVPWGVIIGTTTSGAAFAGANAKRFRDHGWDTLAAVFDDDEGDARCLVDGFLHLRDVDAHIGSGEVLRRDCMRIKLADVIGWAVRGQRGA